MINDWYDTPGIWDVEFELPPLGFCAPNSECFHFMAQSNAKCVQYLNPYVMQDGRRIDGKVEYDAHFHTGLDGYNWTFSVSASQPMHPGSFIFHVETELKNTADCKPTS